MTDHDPVRECKVNYSRTAAEVMTVEVIGPAPRTEPSLTGSRYCWRALTSTSNQRVHFRCGRLLALAATLPSRCLLGCPIPVADRAAVELSPHIAQSMITHMCAPPSNSAPLRAGQHLSQKDIVDRLCARSALSASQ